LIHDIFYKNPSIYPVATAYSSGLCTVRSEFNSVKSRTSSGDKQSPSSSEIHTAQSNEKKKQPVFGTSLLLASENQDIETCHELLVDPSSSDIGNECLAISTSETSTFHAIEGRRIVDITYFFKQLKTICAHGPKFSCSIENLIIIGEKRKGIVSLIQLQCNICNEIFSINTNNEDDESMDLNTGPVSGIISVGSGYYNLEEALTC
ncbi:hypothetical protein CBL_20230, partial [Carabus blaptoides fortunei]